MKKVIHRSLLSVFLLFTLALISGAQNASAQLADNSCCTFRIHAVNGLPEGCTPILVTTSWDGVARTDTIYAKGPTGTRTISFPDCPPAPTTLDWISINGGPAITTVDQGGNSAQFTLCNTCVKVWVSRDSNNCITIGIMLCTQ